MSPRFAENPRTQDETELLFENLNAQIMKKMIAIVVATAAVGFVVISTSLRPLVTKEADGTETLVIASISAAVLMAGVYMLMGWFSIGKSAHSFWLKRNTDHRVIRRIEFEGRTYLLLDHRGKPRLFEFNAWLPRNIVSGSTITIRKTDGGIELVKAIHAGGYSLGDDRNVLITTPVSQ